MHFIENPAMPHVVIGAVDCVPVSVGQFANLELAGLFAAVSRDAGLDVYADSITGMLLDTVAMLAEVAESLPQQ